MRSLAVSCPEKYRITIASMPSGSMLVGASLLKGALKRGETPSLTPQSPLSTYVERGPGGEDDVERGLGGEDDAVERETGG